MLTGVEILLERMKTNPEEFIEGGLVEVVTSVGHWMECHD
jgi:hypothetical protein